MVGRGVRLEQVAGGRGRGPHPFARLIGADPRGASAVGSHAEAAATVAASLPPGRVVVSAVDFRSNLFPWFMRHEVMTVPPRDGATRVEDLIAAMDERVTLLAVSEVTSRDGAGAD